MNTTIRTVALIFASFFISDIAWSQGHGFPFGEVNYNDLNAKPLAEDTSAVAMVLSEFGEAYFDPENNITFEYHIKIKILRERGLEESNFTIPLYKFDFYNVDKLLEVRASSFASTTSGIQENKMDSRDVYTEDVSEHVILKKFAIPNVQVGNVIEVQYRLQSPYIFNFKGWEFQSHLPKLHSEYWAIIPANYLYNIALKGFLKLDMQDAERVRDCFSIGGSSADCSRLKFAMDSIPAFVEEEYMTAPVNFIASLNFELVEIRKFSGTVDKITKEWRDVEEELRQSKNFGAQLKRGKDVLGDGPGQLVLQQQDPLKKAEAIYVLIRDHYKWNGRYNKYSEDGIKKAYESGEGNAGDINLSLVAALRYAGLEADPVLLSTRDNGFVTELYPVLSDFNYVVARVMIDDKIYLLDATDSFIPFGVLPIRCLNGKGRVIGDRKTDWLPLAPEVKKATTTYINAQMQKDGSIKGKMKCSYIGYAGIERRKEIYGFEDMAEYKKDIEQQLKIATISEFEISNTESLAEPLSEKMSIEIEAPGMMGGNRFMFNPFIFHRWKKNPFRSSERLYPVDFGAPIIERFVFTIDLPKNISITNLPEDLALALPNEGGRYLLSTTVKDGKLLISSSLNINRILYTSEEYHFLKELFNRIVQAQNTDIIFEKNDF